MNAHKLNEDERVKFFLEGKHGRIGIIVPDRKPTAGEWKELNESMAAIIYDMSKKEKKPAE